MLAPDVHHCIKRYYLLNEEESIHISAKSGTRVTERALLQFVLIGTMFGTMTVMNR